MTPQVLVTRPIPPAGLEVLRQAGLTLEVLDSPARARLLARVAPVRGLLSLLTEAIDAEVMAAAPELKVVSNVAVGFNNIDVAEATRRGILVCNTPGVLTETTADFTWALMLAAARRLGEGERMVRAGAFTGWDPLMLLGVDLYGSTLGLVGMGRIGQAVARRAAGFEMEVLYTSPRPVPEAPGRPVELEELLRRSDYVSLHVPLNAQTHHLISRTELRLMKERAILINTSRGPVLDEEALVEALREGWIGGAGLDVYEREPEVHPGLLALEQVVLAPHIASASLATRNKMASLAAENLVLALQGQRPHHLVNPECLNP